MCAILLSINPSHVENIFNGNKIYEFRKKACKKPVDKIIIYSTNPVMKVVGEADVEEVLIDTPSNIWKITNKKSGIDKSFFDKYFKDKKEAVAYKLANVTAYATPRELKEYGISSAPQSFQYINELPTLMNLPILIV